MHRIEFTLAVNTIGTAIFYFIEQYFIFQNLILSLPNKQTDMRIFTEKTLKEYIEIHSDAKTAIQEWVDIVKRSEWTCFADVRRTFNSADAVGNQRYVFNIKGNCYRIVAVIKFTIKFVYIRFIGTHSEYDRIDCRNI